MNKLNSTEIGKLAGVSRSTVSRVVNGYSNVPEDTRLKVMKVINENGYYPLLSGQLLVGKKTRTIGFFWIASSGSISSDTQSSVYFVNVMESAAKSGYLVLTCILQNLTDTENIEWIKKIFYQGRIDAGIFIGTNNNEPLIEELISKGKVVGIFDHFHPDRNEPNRISVNFENDTGVKVIDYVYRLGHRKIAVLDGNLNRFSSIKRHEGFIQGMQRNNILINPNWLCYAGITETEGYTATRALLANCTEYPTVICANNDSVAFGAYRALKEAGISVPDQISVIGIDGHVRGEFMSPPLTSFAFDYEAFFSLLVMHTIDAVEQKAENPVTVFMPSRLIERASCRNLVY
ncbi:MAG: LacI family transcriptional regulator [Clostridiales bacterium]|jgi:LacI family transcriptional regulator|nr:LacI family transcriptional regulator [Clostridiales bacterium]